jgi:hypothetical protein
MSALSISIGEINGSIPLLNLTLTIIKSIPICEIKIKKSGIGHQILITENHVMWTCLVGSLQGAGVAVELHQLHRLVGGQQDIQKRN